MDLRKLPLLPLRGMMVFPYMIINLDVGRDRSVAALEEAMVQNRQIMLTAQRNPEIDAPKLDELYEIGTVAEVKQLLKLPGGTIRVLVEGLHRARIVKYKDLEKYVEVEVEEYKDQIDASMNMEAITRAVGSLAPS